MDSHVSDLGRAVIGSSLGWEAMEFTILGAVHDGVDRLRVQLSFCGDFWKRDSDKFDALIPDYEATLLQVLVDRTQLRLLRRRLQVWTKEFTPFVVELCSGPEQSLTFELREREDFVSDPEMPVLSVNYVSLKLSLENRFVVNQSSLKELSCLLTALDKC